MRSLIKIPFFTFLRFITNAQTEDTDITQVVYYIMTKSAHQEDMRFATVVAARKDHNIPWAYEVYPFDWVIFLCDWIKDPIVRMIRKAGLDDPSKHQFGIIRRYPILWEHMETYHLPRKCFVNPLNVIALLLKTPFHYRVQDWSMSSTSTNHCPTPINSKSTSARCVSWANTNDMIEGITPSSHGLGEIGS